MYFINVRLVSSGLQYLTHTNQARLGVPKEAVVPLPIFILCIPIPCMRVAVVKMEGMVPQLGQSRKRHCQLSRSEVVEDVLKISNFGFESGAWALTLTFAFAVCLQDRIERSNTQLSTGHAIFQFTVATVSS